MFWENTFVFSLLVVVPLQVLICEKVKRKILKLLPLILLTVLTLGLFARTAMGGGWEAVGCLLLGLSTSAMILGCIAGWVIWAVWDSQRGRRE